MTTSCIDRVVRRDDGAILTEAVIVVPFFLLLWMGLVALHSLWTARLSAQVLAHASAYRDTALGQCDGSSLDAPDEADDLTAGLDGDSAAVLEAGGGDLLDWSTHLVAVTVEARHIPRPLAGPTRAVTGRARILCNTEPQSDLSSFIFDMIAGWVS